MNDIVCNEEIYKRVILDMVPRARDFLWIGTADIKDMHIEKGRRYYPFLYQLDQLVQKGVEVRLVHAKEPGPRFREDFDSFPRLIESDLFKRVLCPRVHFKVIIVDGKYAYSGSANLTGAGLGAKNPRRRNFEIGFVTEEPRHIRPLEDMFEKVFRGGFCASCERRMVCPDPIV